MGGPGWAMRLPPPHRNAATGTWLDCGTTTGCPTLHLVVAANIHPLPEKKGDAAMSLRPKDGWRERGASPSGRECMWVRRCVSRVFLSFLVQLLNVLNSRADIKPSYARIRPGHVPRTGTGRLGPKIRFKVPSATYETSRHAFKVLAPDSLVCVTDAHRIHTFSRGCVDLSASLDLEASMDWGSTTFDVGRQGRERRVLNRGVCRRVLGGHSRLRIGARRRNHLRRCAAA